MLTLSSLNINLTQSKLESWVLLGVGLTALLAVILSPLTLIYKGLLAILLGLYSFKSKSNSPPDFIEQISFHSDKWYLYSQTRQQSFDAVRMVCQFNWLLILKFQTGRKTHLITVYADQLLPDEFHRLCLCARLSVKTSLADR